MSVTNSISGAFSHFIPLSTAVDMTTEYRKEYQNILNPKYAGQAILPLSETFNRDAIDALLAQPGCAGLRIYYGMDQSLKIHAVLVGVTDKNEDILPAESAAPQSDGGGGGGVIVEIGQRCPDLCPPPSPLNQP